MMHCADKERNVNLSVEFAGTDIALKDCAL